MTRHPFLVQKRTTWHLNDSERDQDQGHRCIIVLIHVKTNVGDFWISNVILHYNCVVNIDNPPCIN